MQQPNHIFDLSLLKLRRNQVANHFEDFLKIAFAQHVQQRLDDIARQFPLALDLGCHSGQLAALLEGSDKVGRMLQCDMAPKMLQHAHGERVAAHAELLPFAPEKFDLVISAGSLHWVNDLPGCLAQIRRILKPDGLFLAVLPGAATLRELRESFAVAEAENGAIRPHISPFVEVRDAGNLLSRAGFSLPVADSDTLTLSYETPLKLMKELKGMGENNHLLIQEKGVLPRHVLAQACAHYAQHFNDASGRILANIELITLTAWAPHASQQQPAKRGSGQMSLKDFL